jgi:hypothetical protein
MLAADAVESARRAGYLHLYYHLCHPRLYQCGREGSCRYCRDFMVPTVAKMAALAK